MNHIHEKIRFQARLLRFARKDKQEIRFLKEHVRRGATVFDVGAHKGGYTGHLLKHIGPSGHLVCFEPQPVLADYLRSLKQIHHWDNVQIEQLALSNRAGSETLTIPAPKGISSPVASLNTPTHLECEYHTETVAVETLDTFCAQHHLAPSFIKCDVEGHEHSLFEGSHSTLTNHQPILFFECEQRHNHNRDIQDTFSLLNRLGYDGWFFHGIEGLIPIAKFRVEKHQNTKPEKFWDSPEYCNNFAFMSINR